jgi:hypothetical protein
MVDVYVTVLQKSIDERTKANGSKPRCDILSVVFVRHCYIVTNRKLKYTLHKLITIEQKHTPW